MGTFLGDKKVADVLNWCCMFGEIEVSCDVLSDNLIRCQVPPHAAGFVPFYVTCGNRLACNEVREFEFLERPSRFECPPAIESARQELSVQIRLAKLLCLGLERKWLDCSAVDCDKCRMKAKICTLKGRVEKSRAKSEEVLTEATLKNCKDMVIQDLLKSKLYEWLVCKANEGNKAPHVLDDEGQGVIHLIASLGYVWALGPIIDAGVGPNFRDKQGRTSLRGFQSEKASEGAPPNIDKYDEYEYLRSARRLKVAGIEKALARVQSMVRHPKARNQYMRLVQLDNLS